LVTTPYIQTAYTHPSKQIGGWMIDQRFSPCGFIIDKDDGHHGWMIPIIGFVHVGGP
jgi:hypothetical protein